MMSQLLIWVLLKSMATTTSGKEAPEENLEEEVPEGSALAGVEKEALRLEDEAHWEEIFLRELKDLVLLWTLDL